jgi:hypothetical protein
MSNNRMHLLATRKERVRDGRGPSGLGLKILLLSGVLNRTGLPQRSTPGIRIRA